MKSNAIKETLAKVLSIDETSQQMEESIEALKGAKEKELRKREREMELLHMKDARKKGKEAYDRVMEEAKSKEADILEEGEIHDKRMRRLYEKHHEDLVAEAMKKIIGEAFISPKE